MGAAFFFAMNVTVCVWSQRISLSDGGCCRYSYPKVDNLIKLMSIQQRLKYGLPVILMGETGCGKTALVTWVSSRDAGMDQRCFLTGWDASQHDDAIGRGLAEYFPLNLDFAGSKCQRKPAKITHEIPIEMS